MRLMFTVLLIIIMNSFLVLGAVAGSDVVVKEDLSCDFVFVDVSASLLIEEDAQGREYDLINCSSYSLSSSFDRWLCLCDEVSSLVMSTRVDTLNNYTLDMTFYKETTTSSRSSRGSTIIVTENASCEGVDWVCSSWSPCIDDERSRACVFPRNDCAETARPVEVMSCEEELTNDGLSIGVINKDSTSVGVKPGEEPKSIYPEVVLAVVILALCLILAYALVELKHARKK